MPFKTPGQRQEYYQNSEDRINEQQSAKCECGCGVAYTKRHRTQHIESMRHKKWAESSNHETIIKTHEEINEEKHQKKKEQAKKWRDKNRDKLREYAKSYSQDYRKTHPEQIEAYQKDWLNKNYDKYKAEIEEIKKIHFEDDNEKIDESIIMHVLIQKLKKNKN